MDLSFLGTTALSFHRSILLLSRPAFREQVGHSVFIYYTENCGQYFLHFDIGRTWMAGAGQFQAVHSPVLSLWLAVRIGTENIFCKIWFNCVDSFSQAAK
jgi:hypothetical protein